MNRFLYDNSLLASWLCELGCPLLADSPEAFLLVGGSVQDKRYSRFSAGAPHQHSGNTHGLVTGIEKPRYVAR